MIFVVNFVKSNCHNLALYELLKKFCLTQIQVTEIKTDTFRPVISECNGLDVFAKQLMMNNYPEIFCLALSDFSRGEVSCSQIVEVLDI